MDTTAGQARSDRAAAVRRLEGGDLAGPEALELMRAACGQPEPELRRLLAEDLPAMVVLGTGPQGHPTSLAAALMEGQRVALEYIAVDEAQRGRGRGRELVERLALLGSSIVAETDDDAVGFYRALGFEVAPAPPDPRWSGVPRFRCTRSGPGPALIERWDRAHRAARMVGWDFSALSGRMTMGSPPWDFEAECLEALRALAARALEGRQGRRPRVLDMGTGGGERLAGLLAQLGDHQRRALEVLATEGWQDNLPVARERLQVLEPAVEVLAHDAEGPDPLPVPKASIDLVMNRHEALIPADAARVLRPGGLLITQQVDGTEVPEVHRWFGTEPLFPQVRPGIVAERSRQAGLVVEDCEAWEGPLELADVEALVEYWGYVPWDVPEDFTVPGYATTLARIHRESGGGPVRLTARRFRLRARRP
ncbi:MAG: GNAT family N-acetyltransferase [Actinomyces bowdenii]|nr:GNAT family N-acetyltransferase [Actinomyces bowdenii]